MRPEQRPPTEVQADDFVALGKMILILACHNPMAPHSFAKSIDYVAKAYSSGFRDLMYQLCTGGIKTVSELTVAVADHTFQSFDSTLHYNDELENQLKKEVENGRIVRLLCKLGFINERPEYDMDPTGRWSETGDRYYLKLFRDYVFHSVDSDNQPVVDLAHVLTCLNKLDAGIDEKVMLVSRDSSNCFVISYKEVGTPVKAFLMVLLKADRNVAKAIYRERFSRVVEDAESESPVEPATQKFCFFALCRSGLSCFPQYYASNPFTLVWK